MVSRARHATWGIITDLHADGVPILLNTHLLDEAERLANDIVIIDRGWGAVASNPQEPDVGQPVVRKMPAVFHSMVHEHISMLTPRSKEDH
ncbi:hypothetical protein GCM10022225_84480 [Plantactinospora mayteni]|uniref:ABC transporter ATP-binding protein n=1 Tax=Plantactinospora mayteni TaxID=566021 RepID=A0ABQ4F4Q1_9ACTN|nr:hypothetical protein [Plantactinospora mayteni]GIH01889.1 hypothetical protein Pma05_84610 [Plantactinospora mayteni]